MRVRLDRRGLAVGVRELTRRDTDLASVISRFGAPPLWVREPGFAALVRIVLAQQVSLASARAAYARVRRVATRVTPQRLAALGIDGFARAGLTRQKSRYLAALADAAASRLFDVGRLAELDDDAARAELMRLDGIGAWSADIYLVMALGRPDVWPAHDLALAQALREVKRLRTPPDARRQLRLAETWRPWRAVAARILWHYYLSTPRPHSSGLRTTVAAGTRTSSGVVVDS